MYLLFLCAVAIGQDLVPKQSGLAQVKRVQEDCASSEDHVSLLQDIQASQSIFFLSGE